MALTNDNAPFVIYAHWQTSTSETIKEIKGTGWKQLHAELERVFRLNPTCVEITRDYRER